MEMENQTVNLEEYEIIYASFWQRLGARTIDVVLVNLIVFGIFGILMMSGTKGLDRYWNAMGGISFIIFYLIYYPILESRNGTYGKKIMSIQALNLKNLEAISLKNSYSRSLFLCWPLWVFLILFMFSISSNIKLQSTTSFLLVMSVIFTILAPLAALWTKNKQGWHDQWTDTIVVRVFA